MVVHKAPAVDPCWDLFDICLMQIGAYLYMFYCHCVGRDILIGAVVGGAPQDDGLPFQGRDVVKQPTVPACVLSLFVLTRSDDRDRCGTLTRICQIPNKTPSSTRIDAILNLAHPRSEA